MASGDTLQSRRLADGSRFEAEPGDYWKVQRDGREVWMACVPTGGMGDLSQHDVTEHENGTITVSPSILLSVPGMEERDWHGYLEAGVWREV